MSVKKMTGAETFRDETATALVDKTILTAMEGLCWNLEGAQGRIMQVRMEVGHGLNGAGKQLMMVWRLF